MTLQTRYAELQSAGRVPLYCYKHAPVDLRKADNVQIALGLQPNGRYLNLVDLDSHTAGTRRPRGPRCVSGGAAARCP